MSSLSDPLEDEWTWEAGIFQSWALASTYLCPLLFVALGVGVGIGKQLWHGTTERGSRACLDFRVDWRHRPTVDQLLQQAQKSGAATTNSYRDASQQEQRTIGNVSPITEADVREAYPDEDLGEKVVLFLRLATVLVSSGMCSTDNEGVLRQVADALSMPPISFLRVGLTEITTQFRLGPVLHISCAADYKLSLLSDAQQLAQRIVQGQASAADGLMVLDQLEDACSSVPYGSTIRYLAMYLVCVLAPITVYRGGYPNLLWAAILSPALLAEVLLLNRFGGAFWETPLVSFTTGLLSPILWQAHRDSLDPSLEPCVAGYTIGVLLLWLPGSSIVYGTHEISRGGYVNGSARLIKGILQAGVIALFYTLGWQYWGRNWSSRETVLGVATNLTGRQGPIASLPPSVNCPSGWDYQLPWHYSSVLWMIPVNACSLIIFNIHLRQGLGVFCVAQAVYAIQGVLGVYCYEQPEAHCALPIYVQTLLVAFAGGVLAQANYTWTGFSQFGTMLCIILVVAPGAGAVKAILGAFHRAEGDDASNTNTLWESVAFEGVAYSVGFYLAFEVSEPLQEPLLWLKHKLCGCCNIESDSNTNTNTTTKGNLYTRAQEGGPEEEANEDVDDNDNQPRTSTAGLSTRSPFIGTATSLPRPGTF